MQATQETIWFKAIHTLDVPEEAGVALEYKGAQIALFNYASRGEWYATQNMCPHRKQMLLGRGMLGDAEGKAKIACPMHKKTFDLKTGSCLVDEEHQIAVYPVKVEDDYVYIQLPVDADQIARPETGAAIQA